MLCTMRELEEKDVVNVRTGTKLGHISDLEVDTECGRIAAIVVSEGFAGFWQGRGEALRIPWENVRCVGEDAILVEIQRETPDCTRKRCRFFFG